MQADRGGPPVSRIAVLALAAGVVALHMMVAIRTVVAEWDGLVCFIIGT